ncbi:MAG: hypothetical protein ACFCVG_14730 [Kineosporiaceae bacterium]
MTQPRELPRGARLVRALVAAGAGPVLGASLLVALIAVPPGSAAGATGTTGGENREPGTAEVSLRDLVATRSETGIVRSAGTVVVREGWAGAVEVDPASEPTADGGGGGAGGGGEDATALDAEPVAVVGDPTGGPTSAPSSVPSSESSSESSSEPTAPSSESSSQPSTQPTSGPTSGPTGDPTTGPGPGPTTAPTGATSAPGGSPPSSAPPSFGQMPSGQGSSGQASSGQVPSGQAAAGGAAGAGQVPSGSAPASGEPGAAGAGAQDGATGVATAVVTALAEVGAPVASGTVLYATDGEPAAAVVSDTPLWRDLDTEADAGPDVRALEQALVDIGLGEGVTVDDSFTAATADAVESWEESLGRADPDGRVTVGEVMAVPDGTTVTRRVAAVGDEVPPGAELLELATGVQEIALDVDATDPGPWRTDAEVVVETTAGDVPGRVASLGTDAAGGEEDTTATLEVVVTPDAAADLATGSAVTVSVVEDQVSDALTVPLGAIAAGPEGEPAVRVRAADGGVTTVDVTYGLVVDGLAEVLTGLEAGDVVVVPS